MEPTVVLLGGSSGRKKTNKCKKVHLRSESRATNYFRNEDPQLYYIVNN